MALDRTTALRERPPDTVLTRDMVGIGMSFAADPTPDAPIEQTLVYASALGMDEHDLRVLSVLTTWMGVHHRHVNADRLFRCVCEHPSLRVLAYWSAVGTWLAQDRRFSRLTKRYTGPSLDLLPVGTAFQIARRGEDARFIGSALRVPAGTLRDRQEDVLSAAALVQQHAVYRNRVRIGPTWRADVWAALERNPDLSVAEVARHVGCSFSTAWEARQDFMLLHSVG